MRPFAGALRLALIAGCLCLMQPGAGANSAFAATVENHSIVVQGVPRTYMLQLPDNFTPGRRHPVVMMLHGGQGNGARVDHQTGLGAYVDRDGFIAVFPDAGGEWNDGRETTRSGRDDVGFLVAVGREVVARSGGDPARMFVGGVSSGGMMAQRLACEATAAFTAYAAVVANMPRALAAGCRPSRRAPILFIESTADPLMPWNGGEVWHGRFRGAGGAVLSAPQTIAMWSRFDGCGAPQTRDLQDVGDGTHVRIHDFGPCGLLFYEIQGGGHTWPGGRMMGGFFAQRLLGTSTHAVDGTVAILDFFRRYGL